MADMDIDREDTLIAALHDGPFESPPWGSFLERLRMEVRANYTGIIFRPADRAPGGLVELYSGLGAPAEVRRYYEEEFYRFDPVMHATLAEGEVYDIADIMDAHSLDHLLYREKILEARDIRFLKVVRISEPNGVTGWMFIARADVPFGPREDTLLARSARHLRHSLRNYLTLEGERLRARVADSAIARLNIGWLTLDATGAVVTRSEPAGALLDHSAALQISRSGKLVAARPAINAMLQTAIGAIAQGGMNHPQAIALSDDPWLNMVLAPFSPATLSVDRTSVMIAYLQGDIGSVASRHEHIAQLFGLLPSEARLAMLMSQGASIVEAADMLGITLETARSYSKRIYAKMGLRGQADLVRTVLTSVLTLV